MQLTNFQRQMIAYTLFMLVMFILIFFLPTAVRTLLYVAFMAIGGYTVGTTFATWARNKWPV